MRIEDLQYDLSPKPPVDDKKWNKEQWLKENPIDFFKMVYVLNQIDKGKDQKVAFEWLYNIIRIYLPPTLFKYYYLSENTQKNTKRFISLANCEMYLARIETFNDPFDSNGFFYDPSKLAGIVSQPYFEGRLIDDPSKYIRSTSLSANGIQSMPLWAHYGNNHAGFCVSYDMGNNSDLSSCTFPVQYADERLDITSLMISVVQKMCKAFEQGVDLNTESLFESDMRIVYDAILLCNVKHSSWSYENEFRCTIADSTDNGSYIKANPKEIFIGMNCSDDNTQRLLTIGNQLGIPVYKMFFDECSSEYELKTLRLN